MLRAKKKGTFFFFKKKEGNKLLHTYIHSHIFIYTALYWP